jgi:hypothetical protein
MTKLHPQLTQEARTSKLKSLWLTMSLNLYFTNVLPSDELPQNGIMRNFDLELAANPTSREPP